MRYLGLCLNSICRQVYMMQHIQYANFSQRIICDENCKFTSWPTVLSSIFIGDHTILKTRIRLVNSVLSFNELISPSCITFTINMANSILSILAIFHYRFLMFKKKHSTHLSKLVFQLCIFAIHVQAIKVLKVPVLRRPSDRHKQ